jgi:catechol 2,3-dioxygenase-like lactoylglutathione lyase family enzyme
MRILTAIPAVLAVYASFSAVHANTPAPVAIAVPATSKIIGPVLYVSDVKTSLKFYHDLLGMTVNGQFGPADRPSVSLGFGGGPAQPTLMLLSDREGPVPRKIEHGHGYDRLALLVNDLRGLQKRLRDAGYSVTDIRQIHEVRLMAMATDPDGYRIELIDSQAVPAK